MFASFQNASPENRGALLLILGISIFGFSDNLTGSSNNETLEGLGGDDQIEPNGGTDIVSGGAGHDSFENIYGYSGTHGQDKLTITDYESYEEIEFEDATWDTNGSFNFMFLFFFKLLIKYGINASFL